MQDFSRFDTLRSIFCCSSIALPEEDEDPFRPSAQQQEADALSLHSNYIGENSRNSKQKQTSYGAWIKSFFYKRQPIALPSDGEENPHGHIEAEVEPEADIQKMEDQLAREEAEEAAARKARRKAKRRAKREALQAYDEEESAAVDPSLWEAESVVSTEYSLEERQREADLDGTDLDGDYLFRSEQRQPTLSVKPSSSRSASSTSSRRHRERLFDPRKDSASDSVSLAPSLLFSDRASTQETYQYLPEAAMSEGFARKRKPKADRRLSKMSANTA